MSVQDGLRNLARQQAVQAPWDFDVFEQRRARAVARRRAAMSGAALSVAVLALVGVLAVVTQPQLAQPGAIALHTAPLHASEAAESDAQPALVDLGQFELTSELEDRIALLDAELSAARVDEAPVEHVRSIEATRAQMNDSLQRVSYAHALLSL
jgi:hypothetical protein